MKERGIRLDDLSVEGHPDMYRILLMGQFQNQIQSSELIITQKDLDNLLRQANELLVRKEKK